MAGDKVKTKRVVKKVKKRPRSPEPAKGNSSSPPAPLPSTNATDTLVTVHVSHSTKDSGAWSKQIRNTLESILHPFPSDTFRKEIWGKKALCIKGGSPDRLKWLRQAFLQDLDLSYQLNHTASSGVHVWMRTLDGRNTSFTVGTDEVDKALECYRCGAGLYFRAPTEMEEAFLPSVGQDLGMNFAAFNPSGTIRAEIETFVSHKGHTTDWHFDFMENITIQLKGSKRWHLRRSGVPAPHRSCATHFEESKSQLLQTQIALCKLHDPSFRVISEGDEYETVEVKEGEVLYHPAGMWHRVDCTEDSVSINLSYMHMSWGELLLNAARHLVVSDKALRERIVLSGEGEPCEEAHRVLTDRLATLVTKLQSLTASDLLPGCMVLPPRAIRSPRTLPCVVELDDSGEVQSCRPAKSLEHLRKAVDAIPTSTPAVRNPMALLTEGGEEAWGLMAGLDHYAKLAKRAALNAEHFQQGNDSDSEESSQGEDESEGEGKDKPCKPFVVHFNAGVSEDGESAMKIRIMVPERKADVMTRLAMVAPNSTAPTVSGEEHAGFAARVVRLLTCYGYFRLASST